MNARRLAMVAGLGVATALTLRWGRGFPWYMAGIAGLAVALLGGLSLAAWERSAAAWRPREPGADEDRDRPER